MVNETNNGCPCICGATLGHCLCHKPEMDYKKLLLKYMQHVQNMEGYTFVDDIKCSPDLNFSKSEILELKNIQLEYDLRP